MYNKNECNFPEIQVVVENGYVIANMMCDGRITQTGMACLWDVDYDFDLGAKKAIKEMFKIETTKQKTYEPGTVVKIKKGLRTTAGKYMTVPKYMTVSERLFDGQYKMEESNNYVFDKSHIAGAVSR